MRREIAKCLPGPVERRDGYLVTQGGVVTWLFGHILRQAEPEEYSASYKRWRAEDLPIIPDKWQLYVAKDCEKQFAIVKGLIEKADEIVHGGDPDREGQLLVDEVLDYLGNKKPVRRILLNALDEKSIKEAEDKISTLENRIKELDEVLCTPEGASDMTVVTEYTSIKKLIDQETDRWEQLCEELEEQQK